MKRLYPVLLAGLVAAGLTLAPNANAQIEHHLTRVTFSAPVEVPGVVLPAGTYVFRLLDPGSDSNVVQIFNADQTKLYATVLAIPDYRLKPTGKTVITFEKRAPGDPEAIRAWFYPGDDFGQQFVYPKVRAAELARSSGRNVASMPSELTASLTKPAKSAAEPHVVAMKRAPLRAVRPSGEESDIKEVLEKTPPVTVAAAEPRLKPRIEGEPATLPQTASSLPLIVLLGLIALVSGLTLRFIVRRVW